MKRALTVAALSVLAAAGCRGSRLEVRTLTTTPSSMTVPLDGAGSAENAIRTEGKDTLVTFRGKTIIVRNLVGYTASITPSGRRTATAHLAGARIMTPSMTA